MKFQAFLRAALTFAAGFLLCVFDHFGFGVPLMLIGLFLFCLVPSASASKKSAQQPTPKKPAAPRKTYAPVVGAPAADAYAYSGPVERYFADLLRSCFPAYTIRENVSPFALGVSSSVSFSFVLYQNGTPAAAVFLCGKYEWDSPEIYDAMKACKKANVPCLRFIKEFRNSADYVVDRINSVLR